MCSSDLKERYRRGAPRDSRVFIVFLFSRASSHPVRFNTHRSLYSTFSVFVCSCPPLAKALDSAFVMLRTSAFSIPIFPFDVASSFSIYACKAPGYLSLSVLRIFLPAKSGSVKNYESPLLICRIQFSKRILRYTISMRFYSKTVHCLHHSSGIGSAFYWSTLRT